MALGTSLVLLYVEVMQDSSYQQDQALKVRLRVSWIQVSVLPTRAA